jgi:hypothetical protein
MASRGGETVLDWHERETALAGLDGAAVGASQPTGAATTKTNGVTTSWAGAVWLTASDTRSEV